MTVTADAPQVPSEPKRIRRSRCVLLVVGSLLVVVVASSLLRTVSTKAGRVEGSGSLERAQNLFTLAVQVSYSPFVSCQSRVRSLHRAIEVGDGQKVGRLIATVIIDGKDCNQALLRCTHSTAELPLTPLPSLLRRTITVGEDISYLLPTERDLCLWALARINPESLIPSPELVSSERSASAEDPLVELWGEYLNTVNPTSETERSRGDRNR